jgi:hypothetical protein
LLEKVNIYSEDGFFVALHHHIMWQMITDKKYKRKKKDTKNATRCYGIPLESFCDVQLIKFQDITF